MTNKRFEAADVRFIVELPPGETIVGMSEHKGRLFVATSGGVYRMSESEPPRFERLMMVDTETGAAYR